MSAVLVLGEVATVYAKAEAASVAILKRMLPALAAGTAPRRPQDPSQATFFPQRRPEDGLIDWSWDARRLRNFIRANSEVSAIASRHTSVLQSGSPEQKAAARAQIQSEALPVLQRHNLDAQTYNAIANAARTDPSVQARLAQLRSSTPGG